MTELEQALNQELTRLRSAVSYIEEANQLTANALAAAAEMKRENELLVELRAVQQQLNTSNAASDSPATTNQTVLIAATAGSALLLSCYALLRRRRK